MPLHYFSTVDILLLAMDRAESNADARPVPTFHPVLRAILEDLVGDLKLRFRTYGASVMTPVTVEGETVEVFWKMEPSESLEVLFDGVLENYSRLSVNVAVWPYYLDAEVNRLRAEIVKSSEALAAMSQKLPPTLATDLHTVANDILQHCNADIHVGVHTWLYVQDSELDMQEYDDHFAEIETLEQWKDMFDHSIWGLIDADEQWPETMADGMSEEDTSEGEMSDS